MIKHYRAPRKTYGYAVAVPEQISQRISERGKRVCSKIAVPFVAVSIILAGSGVAYAGSSGNDRSDIVGQAQNEAGRKTQDSSGALESDPCGLEVVECEGEEGAHVETSNKVADQKGSASDPKTVAGYAIGRYATNPAHEKNIRRIYEGISVKDKFEADEYIHARFPTSPVRGGMVYRASEKYDVDPILVMAIMQEDSGYGTKGLGARTMNPGNVANRDDGNVFTYP
ncbi:MAG: hypothetical protein WC530_10015, partial [Candidatus Omnitrophota bacterium]